MIHYHGTPITPNSRLRELSGEHFCVSFWRPDNVKICHQIGQSVMLDNGAFSAWRKGIVVDWEAYYAFCDQWLDVQTTWAVIPDVITGTEQENDALIYQWPFGHRGAPVWHMHESLERLSDLCGAWPRVCIGSSAEFARVGSRSWHQRMALAMDAICDLRGRPPVQLHMLRGMSLSGGPYPFASADSTDVGRNHNRPQNADILAMARRWDGMQAAPVWRRSFIPLWLLPPYSDMIKSHDEQEE